MQRCIKYFLERPARFFALFSLGLIVEYVVLGPYSYVRIGDNLDIFIPRLVSQWQGFLTEGFSKWSLLFAGGIDRLANDMTYFNAGSVLFGVFPPWLAMGLVIFGTLFLGGWFVYRILAEDFERSRRASMIAGMLFSLALIQTDIIPYLLGLSIVPVVLYYLPRVTGHVDFKRRYGYAVLLGLLFAFFSSVPFTLPFTLSASAVWFLLVQKNYTRRDILVFALFAVAAMVPHLPVVKSLLVNAPLSNRGGDFYQAGLSYVRAKFFELVKLYWFSGALAFMGLLWLRIRDRAFLWVVFLAGLFFTIAVWYQPFATRFGTHFRLVKDFGFDRFYLLIPFFLAFCSAFVIDALRERKVGSSTLRRAGVVVAVIVISATMVDLKIAHAKNWLAEGSFYRNTAMPDLMAMLVVQSRRDYSRVAVISDEQTGLRPTLANMNKLETIDGDINIVSKRYVEFFKDMTRNWRVEPKHSFYLLWQMTDAERAAFEKDSSRFLDPALLSLAGVRYLITEAPLTVSLPGFELKAPLNKRGRGIHEIPSRVRLNFFPRSLNMYENTGVFPRAFLVDDPEKIPDIKKVQSAEIILYADDRVEMITPSSTPGMLVFASNYNPTWRVYVDGEEGKIIPVFKTFMGVALERGKHEVTWKYK